MRKKLTFWRENVDSKVSLARTKRDRQQVVAGAGEIKEAPARTANSKFDNSRGIPAASPALAQVAAAPDFVSAKSGRWAEPAAGQSRGPAAGGAERRYVCQRRFVLALARRPSNLSDSLSPGEGENGAHNLAPGRRTNTGAPANPLLIMQIGPHRPAEQWAAQQVLGAIKELADHRGRRIGLIARLFALRPSPPVGPPGAGGQKARPEEAPTRARSGEQLRVPRPARIEPPTASARHAEPRRACPSRPSSGRQLGRNLIGPADGLRDIRQPPGGARVTQRSCDRSIRAD